MTLQDQINATAPVVVGLDPRLEHIPKYLGTGPDAILAFNTAIIDAVADLVPAVKLQLAFYEQHGAAGVEIFAQTAAYAKEKGLYVIADGKRNDISSTAAAYAETYLGGTLAVDALTVTPYIGSDGIDPFIDVCQREGKDVFVLVKTSNPSSGEIQDRKVVLSDAETKELAACGITTDGTTELYNVLALLVRKYSAKKHVGAVVGATYPEQAATLRKIMPDVMFLVPGYGAQGATAQDIKPCFRDDGTGALVNSSRGIIYASTGEDFAAAARAATEKMIADIKNVL